MSDFVQITPPGGIYRLGAHGIENRWLVRTGESPATLRATANWQDFETATLPPSNWYGLIDPFVFAADADGWMMASGDLGYAVSTDGALGLAWAPSPLTNLYPGAATPSRGARGLHAANGRVVAVSRYGDFSVSDDRGATWVRKGALASPSDVENLFGVLYTGTHWIVWANSTQIAVSADNGDTWSILTPTGQRVRGVAYSPAGWLVVDALFRAFRSQNEGSSWAQIAGFQISSQASVHGRVYVIDIGPSPTVLRSSADLVTWDVVASPSFAGGSPFGVWGGNNALVVRYSSGAYGLWQIGPVPGPSSDIDLPLRLSVQAPAPIDLPLRLSVGTATAATDLPLRLSVLASAVLGGLDGAAGWAAAPDGLWRAVVVLGDDDISDRIGPVSVQIAADAARTAAFSFRPTAALQPMALIGRRVRIAFAQAGGQNAQAVFAGVVDVPSVDLQTGMITCDCTDQAQHVWSNTARADIDALVGGRWHVAVSGEPEDNFAYLRERIQSVPASWALDVQQRPRVLPWRSPARTVTVRTADVIDGSLAADLPSREQLRSRIVCRMQYRHPVLRYRVALAQYSQPLGFFLPELGAGTPGPSKQWLTRGMVESATERMPGWELVSRSVEHPPARSWLLGSGAVYSISPQVAPTLALGFAARYRARWRQAVTQDYTLTVVWPWLESQLPAPSSEEIGATIDAPFDVPGWDSDPTVQPLGTIDAPGDQSIPWHPIGAAPADRDAAIGTLLDRAWVRLWSASRSGRVRFALPCRPDMWLDWRITLEHAALRAAGDVVEIEHTLDNQTGEATTTVALAVGLPGNAAAAAPVWPTIPAPSLVPPPADSAYSFEIGTYVGGEAGAAPFDEASMIGFATNIETPVEGAPLYPHQLSIRAPALTAADRDPASATVRLNIAVDVPTDLLEIPV